MASVNDNPNLTTPRGPSPARPLGPSQNVPKPPATPQPAIGPRRPAVRQDETLFALRPQTEVERQQAILEAVRAAQSAATKETAPKAASAQAEPAKAEQPAAEEAPKTKVVADAIGLADGVRESLRIASSADDLARLPGVGKAVQNGTRLGRIFDAIPETKVAKAIATAMQHNKVLAPASRFLGRIAPVAGVVVAGFDINAAVKVNQDPKASTTEKVLATTKAGLSAIAGAAGVTALALAPTGIGAAIAGGVALGAGLLSLGADLWLGHAKKQREEG